MTRGWRSTVKIIVYPLSICACHPCAGAMRIFSVSRHLLNGWSQKGIRGWRNTVEIVLSEVSNPMEQFPFVVHAFISNTGPAIVFFEPGNLDEVSDRIPPSSHFSPSRLMYIYIYIYIHRYLSIYLSTSMSMSISISISMSLSLSIHIYIYTYIHTYVYTYIMRTRRGPRETYRPSGEAKFTHMHSNDNNNVNNNIMIIIMIINSDLHVNDRNNHHIDDN